MNLLSDIIIAAAGAMGALVLVIIFELILRCRK